MSKLGYSGAVFTVETDEAGQRITEEPYSVTLTQGSTLYGSVSDDMGEPLADRNIYVIPAVVWEQRTESTQHRIEELGQLIAQREHTDEHGLFALPYIPEGEYYVYVASNWNPCKGSTEVKEPMWAGPFELLPGYETGPVNLVIPKK